MDFKTAIIWSGKIYKFLEKLHLNDNISLDYLIDNKYPRALSKLQTYSKGDKIALCATNGKKITLDILNQILINAQKSVITNVSKEGKIYPALTSIVLDLTKGMDIFGENFQKDHYSMAFNEFELSGYFNSMKFEHLILHNLLKDQNDFCSLSEKRRKIQDALILNSKLNLIINADEPYFFAIDEIKDDIAQNKKRNKFYYGFNDIKFADKDDKINQPNDFFKCPKCGSSFNYKKVFYSHIGIYECECGFKRPKPDLAANAKIYRDYSFINVEYKGNKYAFKIPLGGVENAYNALGAIAGAFALGVDRKTISQAFENYKYYYCHDQVINYKNKTVKIKIMKNPTSLTQAVSELYGLSNTKIILCIDDENAQNGDISWIWDSNLEALKNFDNKIYITGPRNDDLALKLKYSGINPVLMIIDSSFKNAIECCYWELEEKEDMVIIATPSCANEIYKLLKK